MALRVEELPHLKLDDDQEERLRAYLSSELDACEADRQDFVEDLKEEIEAYEARAVPYRTTPWEGAATIVVPVIGSMVDATFPRLHATIFGSTTVVTIEEAKGSVAGQAKLWEDVLNWSMINELDLHEIANDWILESIIHGTSVVKLVWERTEQETTTYNEDGEIVKKQIEVIRDQPVLSRVPLEDFYIPFTSRTIRTSPWVAERIRTTYGDLKLKEDNGLYVNIDDMENSTEFESTEYNKFREELENREPSLVDEYEIFEFWVKFDLHGNGILNPLLVTFHRNTGTFLRVQANPYNHHQAPFREIKFAPRHDRFYGMGLARILMPLQDEVSTIHRQRLDNGTIGNNQMWIVVAGSRGDHSFTGAAPGKKILVDDPTEITKMAMGEVSQTSFEMETMALRYAQQRAGLSDFMMGSDIGQTGGRQTATQTVAQLQEQRNRFNWTLEQVRSAIKDLAVYTTDLYQQFGRDRSDRFEAIVGERADEVMQLLNMVGVSNSDRISTSMSLQVTASSASSNRVVEQQNLAMLTQLLTTNTLTYEMPLVQIAMNPQAPQSIRDYALEKIEGMRVLLRRILETADVRNTAEVLGDVEALRESGSAEGAPAGGTGLEALLGGGGPAGQGGPGAAGMGAAGP